MSLPSVVTRIAPKPMRRTMSSPRCSAPAAAAGFPYSFKLLRLCHGPQILLVRLEALRVLFLRFLVGHRGRYDHVLEAKKKFRSVLVQATSVVPRSADTACAS